jgi:CRP-like cAMP-binding protein
MMETPGYLMDLEKYSGSFKKELEDLFELKEFVKGEHLYRQGEVCRHLFYIKKGLVRVYYYSDKGKEVTVWFSSEDTLITAIDSFYCHKPTRDNCEVLEDTLVYKIAYHELDTLLDKKKAHITFFILYEIARKMAELMDSIRFQSAKERYRSLIEKYPSILQRVSLGQVASYLGITQETLSRIRGKI